jgi:hypothetical protein
MLPRRPRQFGFDLLRSTRRLASVLLCSVATLLLPISVSSGASAPADFKPFAPDSIWNLGLRNDAPLDSRSPSYAAWLDDQVEEHGAWINTTACAMPTYWATESTPTVRVVLTSNSYQDPALLRAWNQVPIPSGATPANCADKNLAVIQRQADGTYKEWEFWAATKRTDGGGWVAGWGGVTQDVLADRGIASTLSWRDPTAPQWSRESRAGWHVTASSVSMIAGVITARDVQRGHIDHAISVALPSAAKGRWVFPAQRTDGTSADLDAIPEGEHLRLDPNVDLASLNRVPLVRMMAEAAQKYGIVVRDQTRDAAVFYTDEVRPGETNPFTPLLNGMYPHLALEAFPWASLQVLKSSTCSNPVSCQTTEVAAVDLLSEGTIPRVGEPLSLDTTNSALNQPRTAVEWDLDGNGSYESTGGRGVKMTYVPGQSGSVPVRVRITTRSGTTITGERTLNVAAAATANGSGGESGTTAGGSITTGAPSTVGEPQGPASRLVEPVSRMPQWQEARRLAAQGIARSRREYDKQLSAAQVARRI